MTERGQSAPNRQGGAAPRSTRMALKHATDDAHRRLDRDLSLYDLRAADEYAAFLRVQARAMVPLEAALEDAGVARMGVDWGERRRAGALLEDLEGLGSPVPPAVPAPIGPVGPAAALGVLYVLEGSRMGGAMLAREAERGEMRVRDNMRFLRHGAGQRLWPRLMPRLEAVSDPHDLRDAIRAAGEAFEAFALGLRIERGEPSPDRSVAVPNAA